MKRMDAMDLTHHFLIAMPSMNDPNFHRAVTYICSHNEEGAMGIIINKPLDIVLAEILEQMDIVFEGKTASNTPIYDGGPVQSDRGFVLHEYDKDWSSSLQINDQIGIATSLDILNAIANDEGPKNAFITLGYAGWSAGQLEIEMQENIWLSGPADSNIIFNTPINQRWSSAVHLLGINLDQLSSDVGHA